MLIQYTYVLLMVKCVMKFQFSNHSKIIISHYIFIVILFKIEGIKKAIIFKHYNKHFTNLQLINILE